ncbi:MAG: hypothetical protein HFJ29_01095 [Clostridia bacterium]|nr:hypothetical protein [Clostridia bacterium]
MKSRKVIINILFYLISFIILINCAKIILEEQTYLKVNESNRQSINAALKEVISSDSPIAKISIGNGFHCGEFYVYYEAGKKEKFIIDGSKIGKVDNEYIDSYVRENGYNYDNIAMIVGIAVSILVVIATIIKATFFIRGKVCKLGKS